MSAPAGSRRYSILITHLAPDSDMAEEATWHSVTAASLGEVLRAVRSGAIADARYEPGLARVDAVECRTAS